MNNAISRACGIVAALISMACYAASAPYLASRASLQASLQEELLIYLMIVGIYGLFWPRNRS
jgi:hypothetical protein